VDIHETVVRYAAVVCFAEDLPGKRFGIELFTFYATQPTSLVANTLTALHKNITFVGVQKLFIVTTLFIFGVNQACKPLSRLMKLYIIIVLLFSYKIT
jgi:hypothetical protein